MEWSSFSMGAERKTFVTLSTQNWGTEVKVPQVGNFCRHTQVSYLEEYHIGSKILDNVQF